MARLALVPPGWEHEEQVMAYRQAFFEAGSDFDGCAGLNKTETYAEWLDFEGRLSRKYGADYVPSRVFLAMRDEQLVGMLDIRTALSEFLLRFGGNIGYSVLPKERGQGYAGEMLALALEKCRDLGMDKVLVTCDPENIPSAKTIRANGGVLENEVEDTVGLTKSGVIQRSWITL